MNKDEKKVSRRLPTQTTETVASVVEVPECAEPTTHVHGTKVATFVTDVETGIRRRTYKDWKGSFAQWLNGGGPKPALVRTSAYIYRVLADNPTRRIGAIGDHFDEMAKSGLDVSSIGFDLYHSPFKNIGLGDLTEHFNLWENVDHLLFNEQEKKVMDALLILFFEQDRVFTTPIAVSIREWLPLTVKLVGENLACGSAYREHVYDYVMLCAGIYAFSVVSHNYDIASTLYKKYLAHKVRFITRVALEADDIPVEAAVEEAVEPDNSREVGVVLDTPTSGTVKITGIGTPELACEVIPDEAEAVITQDTVYEDTARALSDGMSVALPRSNVTVQIHKHDPEDPVPGTLVEVSTGEVVGEQNPIVKVKELESIPLCTEGRMEEGGDPVQLTDVVEEPVPYPLRLDSLSQELKRVSLAFLAMPQEARDAALREILANTPEKTFTVLGGVNVEAGDDVVKGGDVPELVGDARSATSNSLLERNGGNHDLRKHYGPEALPILKSTDAKAMHESIMKKVTRKKRGWLTGKFCMLHMGHINFIHQAATLCDELVVVLSHSDHRFKDSRLSYRNKMLWLRTTFKNEPHITVVGIDETDVPEYPNGWQAWSDLVKDKIGTDFDYIFTSEPGDQSGYNTHFPGQEVRVVDAERKGVDISATRIRGDMVKHWGMMPTVVRKDFVMRICIVGTESVGKSTLTKMLAKRHQTSWVEEYGRTYCEQDLCMDEDLLCYEDYGTIAARRYDMEQEAALSANRVLFVDTAAMSTNYFCLLYEGREHPMVSAYQERERYDAYIYLTDDVAFVEDGLRKNRNRDNTRFLFEKMLYANAKRHGSEIFKVSGNYNERLNKAIAIVDELLARPLTLV